MNDGAQVDGGAAPATNSHVGNGAATGHRRPIRVVIADDQRMVREALAALLNLEEDIEIVAQLEDGSAVVPTVAETGADIALLDIEMPGVDGIAAAQALQAARILASGAVLIRPPVVEGAIRIELRALVIET
ncbi:response regulator, partial [Actinotignum timonense]